MAAKNVKPAAKSKGGPGAATKKTTPAQKPVDQAGQAIGGSTLGAAPGLTVSTGNQEQPGAPAADSAVAAAPAQPGAEPNCFASSSPKSIPGLAVTSSRDGFWRAGRQWTKAEQRVALADMTDDEANQIIEEPMLTVTYIDLASPAEGA